MSGLIGCAGVTRSVGITRHAHITQIAGHVCIHICIDNHIKTPGNAMWVTSITIVGSKRDALKNNASLAILAISPAHET